MDKETTRKLALKQEWKIRLGFLLEIFCFMTAGFVFGLGRNYFWTSLIIVLVSLFIAVIVGDWIKDQSILMYKGGLLE